MLQYVKAHRKLSIYAFAILVVGVVVALYGFAAHNYIAVGFGCLLVVIAYALFVAPIQDN